MSGGDAYRRVGVAAALAVGTLVSGCAAGDFDVPWLTSILGPTSTGTAVTEAAPSPVVLPAPPAVVVGQGDTVYGISRRYDVHMRAIIRANELAPPYILTVGQTLVLPQPRTHVVQSGDTLLAIARRYDADMNIVARLNELAPPYIIRAGEKLLLPDQEGAAAAAAPAPVSAPVVVRQALPQPVTASPDIAFVRGIPIPAMKPIVASVEPAVRRPVARAVKPPEPPPRVDASFAWPVKGKVLSGFGPGGQGLRNDGINIAVPVGTPVTAAENGVVVYVGNELRGFGNLVLLKHSDGWMTAYAHNSRLTVAHGETVKRGQIVAYSGQSGNVDQPQVHFEVRKGSRPVDPMTYLQRPVAALDG